MQKYNSIGKIVATFGLHGEVVLKHHLGKQTTLSGLEALFIEEGKDNMIPYFLVSSKVKNSNELYLKFEGIDIKEDAQKLSSREVWLGEDDFHKYAGKSAPISLLGYHIINDGEDIGEILEVIEQPHQLLCRIDLEGNEALIPVHEDTIEKTDKKNKLLHLSLPDGLLDIYR